MTAAISIRNLYKSFTTNLKTVVVVDDLSFDVQPGEVFGFLGANGAGKTTTIKILMGLVRPTRGELLVFGETSGHATVRKRVSFLPEHPQFPRNLTATEFLKLSRNLSQKAIPLPRIQEVLDTVGLSDARHKRITTFSKGMQQRLGIAQALLPDPDLLVLDEPMSGLDPLGRQEVAELLLSLKRQKKTIFFSTHILSDAQLLCDRIAFLRKGQLLEVYDNLTFSKTETWFRTLAVIGLNPLHLESLDLLAELQWTGYEGETLHIDVKTDLALWAVLDLIRSHSAHLLSISINPQSIRKYWS